MPLKVDWQTGLNISVSEKHVNVHTSSICVQCKEKYSYLMDILKPAITVYFQLLIMMCCGYAAK